jgi:ABC-2 type transport system permease protein
MLRRNFKHTLRDPVTVFNAVLLPIVIMIMFVCVIGGASVSAGRRRGRAPSLA